MTRIDRLDSVLDIVHEHPETYNQQRFCTETDCDTAFCIAGWCCVLYCVEEGFLANDLAKHVQADKLLAILARLSSRETLVNRNIFMARAEEWLDLPYEVETELGAASLRSAKTPEQHALFRSSARLSDIIFIRNALAAEQGLPAYIPPKERNNGANRQA